MFLRQDETADGINHVDHDREVWHTAKLLTGSLYLVEVVPVDAQVGALPALVATAPFDRNAHQFLCAGVPGDQVDASVIHARTLDAVLARASTCIKRLGKVARDLGVIWSLPDRWFARYWSSLLNLTSVCAACVHRAAPRTKEGFVDMPARRRHNARCNPVCCSRQAAVPGLL